LRAIQSLIVYFQ